ncbi:DUF2007 domain-containing protein [Lysobacter ciconiae]|uniref:DUF2007 domain-containing protein n=1 Tax=Novilysobacter ciconiae TaxID=2781022 RepID=A0A7S6ZU46_9GAMM|nr:DUF2007 domain-containing protein [Lysobacter ciconiae]QOW20909.1 DUF2007 domain-containing protein [Lysobacter ciconiae]
MRVVYEAAGIIDAHLVRHALEAADIPVFVKGEALLGGMGELPMFGLVQVCVPEAAWTQAREVVDALELGNPVSLEDDQIDWLDGAAPAV